MRIECPDCHFSKEVDQVKVPPEGATARCPSCSKRFFVVPSEVAPANIATAKQACPKCGFELDEAKSCGKCGLIYEKYLAAQKRRVMDQSEALTEVVPAAPPPPTPLHSVVCMPFRFGHGRSELLAWTAEGHLAPAALPQALGVAGILPGPREWRRFLDGLALWLGVVFLAASVIFFFAFNWQKLGRYIRFGSVEAVLLAAIIAAWRLGLERLAGKAALLLATLLVGALLALVGQTYQTGVDPWELFATWALFVLPWVAISRFSPLWLFLLLLLNLAVILYYRTFVDMVWIMFGAETIWWILAGVNTVALVVWELAAGRGVPWLAERWSPRTIATAAAGFVTVLAVWGIVDRKVGGLAEIGVYSGWLAGAYVVYRHRVRDLYVLSIGVLSLIIVVAVFLGHNMFPHMREGEMLTLGMIVLGLSAAGGRWLRSVAREVEG